MFMKTIYDVYFNRKRNGLIPCPWPPIEKGVVKMVLLSIFNHIDEPAKHDNIECEDDVPSIISDKNDKDKDKKADKIL
jgi:hypothetical protein